MLFVAIAGNRALCLKDLGFECWFGDELSAVFHVFPQPLRSYADHCLLNPHLL
jgi:hypothetical protein